MLAVDVDAVGRMGLDEMVGGVGDVKVSLSSGCWGKGCTGERGCGYRRGRDTVYLSPLLLAAFGL